MSAIGWGLCANMFAFRKMIGFRPLRLLRRSANASRWACGCADHEGIRRPACKRKQIHCHHPSTEYLRSLHFVINLQQAPHMDDSSQPNPKNGEWTPPELTPTDQDLVEYVRLTGRSLDGREEGLLCQECSQLRTEDFLDQDVDDGRTIIQVDSFQNLSTHQSSCLLCRLFTTLISPPRHDEPFAPYYHATSWSASWLFTGLGARVRDPDGFFEPTKVLSIGPGHPSREEPDDEPGRVFTRAGYIAMEMPDDMRGICEVRRINPAVFDMTLAEKWLSYCETNHGAACSGTELPDLANLKVFNCHTRRVTNASRDCRYVALSYVWAGHEAPAELSPSTWMEKVIEASILVAKGLGFDYLWVDKICIDQTNDKQKMHQIRQMDLIYARAALTIIAAAGSKPSHGLPGVDGTVRTPQQGLRVGNMTLLSTLPSPIHTIEQSRWHTRGWTFQEGMLSTKRLIFTEHQVLFECNSMHCNEAVRTPLGLMHGHSNRFDMLAYDMGAFTVKTPGSDPSEYMSYVHSYSQRELTFGKDKLMAFEGVMNAFKRAKRPVYTFWGQPIFVSEKDMPHYVRTTGRQRGSKGSTKWSMAVRFAIGLFWQSSSSQDSTSRIEGFPSWSWAGWTGVMDPELLIHANQELSTDLQISLEDSTHNMVSLNSIKIGPQMGNLEDQYLDGIYIEAWTIVVYLSLFQSPPGADSKGRASRGRYYACFEAQPEGNVYTKLESYDHGRHFSDTERFLGFLASPLAEREDSDEVVMLLQNVGDHYERVGVFRLAQTRNMVGGKLTGASPWHGVDKSRRGFWLR